MTLSIAALIGGLAIGLCFLSTFRRRRDRYTLPDQTLGEQARAFDQLPLQDVAHWSYRDRYAYACRLEAARREQ